jgi:O-antigen ligase
MGFFLMLAAVYLLLKRESKNGETASTGAMFKIFLLVFGAMAIFCLYESRVRTVMLGLLVFSAIVVGFYYKRVKLMLIGAALVLVAPFVLEPLKRDLIPEAAQAERDPTFDPTTGYGSGRPMIWKAYIEEFLSKPVDRQIAGVGIGNSARKSWGDWPFWLDAHNEFLNVMVFSGYVGLGLFMALQVAFVKRIVSLEGREKYVFLAFFVAVMVMNFVSNSYVTRFGLAQMFYVVLAYIEVRGRELKANEVNAVAQAYR